jgi:hypothetical protein
VIELSVEFEEGVGVRLGLRFADGSEETASSRICWAKWIVIGVTPTDAGRAGACFLAG